MEDSNVSQAKLDQLSNNNFTSLTNTSYSASSYVLISNLSKQLIEYQN